ncbi:hypothetical protein QQS21_009974 [Conoideocrella luteorostrata]|uniref:Uncharacterized protein n=1 Tax=Conoideocrella luteorostrata TaxID=1105319 RepID=A0AAJ0FPU5_9HYPO|nr:hypothetical protein QQS21_009974 [Conoideocrella luteorostrata]
MRFFSAPLALLLSSLAVCHGKYVMHAYYLDKSCEVVRTTLETWMKNAADTADAALKAQAFAVEKCINNPPEEHGPVCEAIYMLIKSLLAFRGQEPRDFIISGKWDDMQRRLQRAKAWDVKRDGTAFPLDPSEDPGSRGQPENKAGRFSKFTYTNMVFYCDYTRLMDGISCDGGSVQGKACDTSIGRDVDMDNRYTECRDSRQTPSQMSTWVRIPPLPMPEGGSRPNPYGIVSPNQVLGPIQIQFCPGYMADATGLDQYKVLEDGRKVLANARIERPGQKAAVEYAMLGDGRLLHALLRTYTPSNGGKAVAYKDDHIALTWADVIKLDDVDKWASASTVAFFAVGAKLLFPPQDKTPLTIDPTRGTVVKLRSRKASDKTE